jgi:predicted DNA binding CopG/RHH family protein
VTKSIEEIVAEEAAWAEALEAADIQLRDLSEVTTIRGGPRSKTLQVRLSENEWVTIERQALASGVPISTLARNVLVPAVQPATDIEEAITRLEADVRALRELIAA